jgi:hypothetical protein
LGESVSGLYSYRKAKQISEEQFEKLDSQAYKLENGLLKLVASSERKRDRGDWIDHHFSNTPALQHSNTISDPGGSISMLMRFQHGSY